MPRRSSGGRSAPRAAPRAAPLRNPPQPARSAPPPAPVQGQARGGIGSAIVDGIGLGTGMAIAHRAVDSMFGPRTVEIVGSPAPAAAVTAPVSGSTAAGSDACSTQTKAFQDCINHFGSDISKCQFYFDTLNECRRASGATLGV